MNRWNEIIYGLGLNILMPRLCLFLLLPLGFCGEWPATPAVPWLLRPSLGIAIITVCVLLFVLSVAANLSISRYLRRHQKSGSPYTYDATSYVIGSTGYFRIRIMDTAAFRQYIKTLRRDHRGEIIWFWQWVDDLVFVPPILFGFLVALPFFLLSLLVQAGWARLTHREPRPV